PRGGRLVLAELPARHGPGHRIAGGAPVPPEIAVLERAVGGLVGHLLATAPRDRREAGGHAQDPELSSPLHTHVRGSGPRGMSGSNRDRTWRRSPRCRGRSDPGSRDGTRER